MLADMTIGQLAARSGLSVRTLRFYSDAGVLPEAGRTESGYRRYDAEAVTRARLVRTLRELGVGLDDVKRVLAAETSLSDVAAAHARALDVQIRTLRQQRALLSVVARTTDPQELTRMTESITLTDDERRRLVADYLDAVFGDDRNPVADRYRSAAPVLPDDPTEEQVAAWVQLAELLRDPDYVAAGQRMVRRAAADPDPPPDPTPDQRTLDEAVTTHAGAAVRAGTAPDSALAREIVERIEAAGPDEPGDRAANAERIAAFTDRRVARYWTLVGIVNGWPKAEPSHEQRTDAWEWYARALRAHA